jgi:Icc-related predicted phosphoesterase
MKILSVADRVEKDLLESVGGGPAIDGIELILSCGDLPPEYLAALRNRYETPLLYVLGNHDLRYGKSPPSGCVPVDRQLVKTGGMKIVGFSGSRWYNGAINQYSEEQMAGFVGRLRFTLWRQKGVDLVLTHAPPRFIHDAEDRCHRGFRTFRWFIDKYRPRFFIHGHIHSLFADDKERITMVNSTSVINSYGYFVFQV